jgi:hypothetical protein
MEEFSKFVEWWKDHRHSGFYEDDEHFYYWGIKPSEAWACDRYRAEYSSDTGTPYRRPIIEGRKLPPYTSEEIEKWAQEKHIADEIVEKFKAEHDGREYPTVDEAHNILIAALAQMRKNFMDNSKEAKTPPEPKYYAPDITVNIERMTDEEINERRSTLANQVDAIQTKFKE